MRAAIDKMHALGLKVMLKPHVDVEDGTWRAQIVPASPDRWFESYAAFMDHYVAIAAEKKVEMLCIGTELASMSGSQYAAQWASLIARIRSRYAGLLTYAANGVDAADEFTSVSFWGQVDLIGADVYTPLTDKTNPTRQELAAGWRRNRNGQDMVAAFSNVQKAYGKPFLFTEVGYRSGDGANRRAVGLGPVDGVGPRRAGRLLRGPLRGVEPGVVLDEGPVLVGVGREPARSGRHRLQPARQARRGRAEAVGRSSPLVIPRDSGWTGPEESARLGGFLVAQPVRSSLE